MKKIIQLIIIVIFGTFLGYQLALNKTQLINFSKKIVKISERYYYFGLNKIGLRDLKKTIDKTKIITHDENEYKEVKGNSFTVRFSKIKSYPGRTATVFMAKIDSNNIDYDIFTQDGFIIKKDIISEINYPSFFYSSTGIRSIFSVDNDYFALGGFSTPTCKYASLFRLKDSKNVLKSKCLPDPKKVDFDGLGGAYVKKNESILITIGTPVHYSEEISQLAQSVDSIFGKIISINKNSLRNYQTGDIDYDIYTMGHRNPQGLVKFENSIFSLEHGPQGGDELNKIVEGRNYGWPITSLGTRYNDGKSYPKTFSNESYQEPFYAFLPAVAPSALNVCPNNLSNYYKPYKCLMGLSLRERSILIFILDKDKSKVIIFEKINLGGRLRHFGTDKKGELFVDNENYFYISMDRDGLYKIKFDNFR